MQTVKKIAVAHYFNYPVYFPFMTDRIYYILEKAYINKESDVIVPKKEFERMIDAYFYSVRN